MMCWTWPTGAASSPSSRLPLTLLGCCCPLGPGLWSLLSIPWWSCSTPLRLPTQPGLSWSRSPACSMSVTPAEALAGLLPVVISSGRPALVRRPTARLLPALAGVTADPVWLVRDDEAPGYERDRWELATYPLAEAEGYAEAHWTSHKPYAPGGFLGAFTAREWACR